MDTQALARDIELRAQRLQAVDELLSAVESRDVDRAIALSASPAVREALPADVATRLEVLSCFANSGSADLLAEALDTIRSNPSLVSLKFGGGCILLHRAAFGWNVPFVRLLLELGSNPDQVDVAGHPPLYYLGNASARRGNGDRETADILVGLFARYGADLNRAEGVKRSTPLHMAARRGSAALAAALAAHGANLEARDSNLETPLRRAVNCSQPQVVRTLLQLGADPDSRCKDGRRPRDAARSAEMKAIFSAF